MTRTWTTPRGEAARPIEISNAAGLRIRVLPNGTVQTIEAGLPDQPIRINQIAGSPVAGGALRLWLRLPGPQPTLIPIIGPGAETSLSHGPDRVVWSGAAASLSFSASLILAPDLPVWFWLLDVISTSAEPVEVEAMLAQDLGLGPGGFLMNNEAYASQYMDHTIFDHAAFGPVVMSRQNLAQDHRHPWVAHLCLDGTAGYATDALQLFGPAHRNQGDIDPETVPPSARRQHEMACAILLSQPLTLAPHGTGSRRFAAVVETDHSAASGLDDLTRLGSLTALASALSARPAPVAITTVRGIAERAPPLAVLALTPAEIRTLWPVRHDEEWREGALLSWFCPDDVGNRHVVLAAKDLSQPRRHGAIIRSGASLLPSDPTLCATCWMEGNFGAQLTIGNTSFHKLFAVSREAYGLTTGGGLRLYLEVAGDWHRLAVPSVFEIGLGDCRWIYRTPTHTITVAVAGCDAPCLTWTIDIEGSPCRLLAVGHLVMGEREGENDAPIDLADGAAHFICRFDPTSLWGSRYPNARFHFLGTTPDMVEAAGGDELLFADGQTRGGAVAVMRTRPTRYCRFAVVGTLDDPDRAAALAAALIADPAPSTASAFWRDLMGKTDGRAPAGFTALIPWLVHDMVIHMSVPHGLEQYTGAAWGTRDAAQGPVEGLLALGHHEPVREIVRIIFAQQYRDTGDWPQWFMLEPYSIIQDRSSHGDVIVWPLKALNDVIEATGDAAILEEAIPWRDRQTLAHTEETATIAAHIDRMLRAVRDRFLPGTSLIRYGEGDWNDALQPVDPGWKDRLVSAWTVGLLQQQLARYAALLERHGRVAEAGPVAELAAAIKADFRRLLMPDGIVAGYALFEPGAASPSSYLLHPRDDRTGISYSLLPFTQAILADLFTADEIRRHLDLAREHLEFPDGMRLMDRPARYHGGLETIFRRAESASFFGREIGLMYVHAHLRWAEVLAKLGDQAGFLKALRAINPVTVAGEVPGALPRQRNCYFSSSDAAFPDRAAADAEWHRVKDGTISFDGGWRIYSSGPGLFLRALLTVAPGSAASGLIRHEIGPDRVDRA